MRRDDREVSDIVIMEEIISNADVCRVAFANNNIPYIVTMNYGYSASPDRTLYFHCAPAGRKIEMLKINDYVCFEIDTDHQLYTGDKGCDWGMKYSSVVGFGHISVITDPELKKEALDNIMRHYGGDMEFSYNDKVFERTTILSLRIEEMTGKKC